MAEFDRRSRSDLPLDRVVGESHTSHQPRSGSSPRDPKAYLICDRLTAGIICWMIIFTPWAFGSTQVWAVWTMNITGYVLGGILLTKWLIARQTGYRPPRWDRPPEVNPGAFELEPQRRDWLTLALAILTGFILIYSLVGALNARAIYLEGQRRFEYRSCINWLPHSYDRSNTWFSFWTYLGLACFFWAARDWLLGKGGHGRRKRRHSHDAVHLSHSTLTPAAESSSSGVTRSEMAGPLAGPTRSRPDPELPGRLRLLLWVLCINGALLALEAILQRVSGTNKLLWLVQPRFNTEGLAQFGPYAYRANAASYFNLLWPVCFGFWLVLRRAAQPTLRTGHRLGSGNYLVLLPGAVLMAACPIISTSRGGALIAVAGMTLTLILLLRLTRKESPWLKLGIVSLFVVILGFSAVLGLKQLVPRFQTIFTDQMSRRSEIYQNALPIAHDFPVLGTGAGSFGALYQLYRADANQDWAAYVHDDWLETRITFGWVGLCAIVLMLATALARWFVGPGIRVSWEFAAMIWLAMGGCLLHAKFDFPFQVYSVIFLFLLLAAIIFCLAPLSSSRAS